MNTLTKNYLYMKKQLLSLTASLCAVFSVSAQAPDMGFETWQQISPPLVTAEDPVGWASFNAASLFGMPLTVTKETTAPGAGSTSAKVVTDILPSNLTIQNPFAPGQTLDTVGVLAIGKPLMTAPYAKYGYSYTTRSAILAFKYKYIPNGKDTGYVFCYLTKWNGTSRDYIATGMFKTPSNITTWTNDTINLIYNPVFNGVAPDSQQIYISSSIYIGNGAKKGSTMYVDGFAWGGTAPNNVGVNDIHAQQTQVTIYPNPASTSVNFKSNVDAKKINIMDVTGRLMGTYDLTDNKVTIPTENYSSGIYFYHLFNANNEIISRNKFEVLK